MPGELLYLAIYLIFKLYLLGNHGSHDIELLVMMAARFSASEVLSMCYYSDFGLSEDESSCDEGDEVHVCRGPRIIAPEEV